MRKINTYIINLIGYTELAIGLTVIVDLTLRIGTHISSKPVSVFVFVYISAIISLMIGMGILIRSETARKLLVYFASLIIIVKVLIFFGIIELKGEIQPVLPKDLKNMISLVYHLFICIYLSLRRIRDIFV